MICGLVQLTVQVLSVCSVAGLCKLHIKEIKTLCSIFLPYNTYFQLTEDTGGRTWQTNRNKYIIFYIYKAQYIGIVLVNLNSHICTRTSYIYKGE